jgi:CRP-like cAMP-binding protein
LQDYIDIIEKCELFGDMSRKEIEMYIIPRCREQSFPRGKYLISPQEELKYFGIVLEGEINNQYIFQDGSCGLVKKVTAGDIFGSELISAGGRTSPCYSLAVSQVRMLSFPVQLFSPDGPLPIVCRDRLIMRLLALISGDSLEREFHMAILARRGLRERVMTYLHLESERRGSRSFRIGFSREELASYLCVNRSALSHELSLMEQDGLISFRKNEFTLLK